jgi:hypothetical protein
VCEDGGASEDWISEIDYEITSIESSILTFLFSVKIDCLEEEDRLAGRSTDSPLTLIESG